MRISVAGTKLDFGRNHWESINYLTVFQEGIHHLWSLHAHSARLPTKMEGIHLELPYKAE